MHSRHQDSNDQEDSNDQDQTTKTHGPSTQLPAHIHKVIGVKGREIQLPAHSHKVIGVKGRETQLPVHIHKVIGVKGRETQLPAHIHKLIRVKGRERRTKRWRKQNSLTQINFWTNQPMEKSYEMTTKSFSWLPGTNFQILANQ